MGQEERFVRYSHHQLFPHDSLHAARSVTVRLCVFEILVVLEMVDGFCLIQEKI